VVAVENVVLNVLLIPRYSLNGAAFATTVTELTRAAVLMGFAMTVTGPVSLVRIAVGPVAGCCAMGLIAWALGMGLLGLAVAAIAYPPVVLAVEHLLFPRGVRAIIDGVLRRRAVA
jgi:O-antigen/teichoic acid export membrane protein